MKKIINNKMGVVDIDGLRDLVHNLTEDLTNFSYNVTKDTQKKIDLVVEYYIMNYYQTDDIDSITREDLGEHIQFCLSIIMESSIYMTITNKKYTDVLWWVIYSQFGNEKVCLPDYQTTIVSRVFEAYSCVEGSGYSESYLDVFHDIQLEECIKDSYCVMMSQFLYGNRLNF